MMTKKQLTNIFMEAKRNKCDICVELTIPGQNDTEFIVNKNKSILISIGCGAQYNFGTYLDAEKSETEYGTAVLEMLQAELEAIKAKIVELTAELEVADETAGGVEETVTSL